MAGLFLEGSGGGGGGPIDLDVPANIEVTPDDLNFTVQWDAVDDADGYEVQIDSGDWIFTPTNSFTGTTFAGDHTVNVRAVIAGDSGTSDSFEAVNPIPLIVAPNFVSERHSAADSADGSIHPNDATHSNTIPPGFKGVLIVIFQHELPVGALEFRADRNGQRGHEFFCCDGYAGDDNGVYVPGNLLYRGYIFTNPTEGTFNTTFKAIEEQDGAPVAGANELAVCSLVIDNVADIFFPIRDLAFDISGTLRGADAQTVDSVTTDLVIHSIGHSLTPAQLGSFGAGETQISAANDLTGDSSLVISRKQGGAGTTSTSSAGGAVLFCYQGVAFSLKGYGETEDHDLFTDDGQRANETPISNGANWTTPIGAPTVTQVNLTSNAIVGSTSGENIARVNDPAFPNDQYAEIAWSGNTFSRACVRMQSDSDASCYALTVVSSTSLDIRKLIDTGSVINYSTVLLSQVPFRGLVAGDKVGLRATGTNPTTLDIFINGHKSYTVQDSTSTYQNGQPAIARFGSGSIASRFFACSLPFNFDAP